MLLILGAYGLLKNKCVPFSFWIAPHSEYLALAKERDDRLQAYRSLFQSEISELDINEVRKSTHYCQPLGNDHFRSMIESKYSIKLGQMKRGRPKMDKLVE